ncbi:MAG: sigma-54-dependent transcriptional regulator [Nitrospirota bacterium]
MTTAVCDEEAALNVFRVLIVDDEKSMREVLSIMLRKEGYAVTVAAHGPEALSLIDKEIYDLVISDVKMPGLSGIDVLKAVKAASPTTIVLMMTAFASTETAVEAMREGAYDYLTKPFKIDEVKLVVKNALERKQLQAENSRLKQVVRDRASFEQIVGRSEKLTKVLDLIRKVADTNSNVLIFGESGTGKELVARAIHYNSRRQERPFVTVNCSALPEPLLESELFGHMKGAFTGAVSNKEGLFEIANEGTLFLDEIGDTPLGIQVKLLRVLQEKEFRRVGGTRDLKSDVRIVAATNRDLEKAIAEGRFREDLYYRLDVIPIRLPPLRERPEDIPLLVDAFLRKLAGEMGKTLMRIEPDAVALLGKQEWRGNVRELENVMERIVALASGGTIGADQVRDCLPRSAEDAVAMTLPAKGLDLEGVMATIEKDLLLKALQRASGVKKDAAGLLGLDFRSFRYRLSKYGIK